MHSLLDALDFFGCDAAEARTAVKHVAHVLCVTIAEARGLTSSDIQPDGRFEVTYRGRRYQFQI